MNSYILFAGDHYYPLGGMNDSQGDFSTVEAAEKFALANDYDWWHILDIRTMQIVGTGN